MFPARAHGGQPPLITTHPKNHFAAFGLNGGEKCFLFLDYSSPAYLQLLLFLQKPVLSGDGHAQVVLSSGLRSGQGLGVLTARP